MMKVSYHILVANQAFTCEASDFHKMTLHYIIVCHLLVLKKRGHTAQNDWRQDGVSE